jgi:hypothetical protein
MSDEPKKRSRAWIGWALVPVLVGYPVSAILFGLADWWLSRIGYEGLGALNMIFYPIWRAVSLLGD